MLDRYCAPEYKKGLYLIRKWSSVENSNQINFFFHCGRRPPHAHKEDDIRWVKIKSNGKNQRSIVQINLCQLSLNLTD